ncbi:hypothetical protein, partial [Paenibacillus alginolyticus]|uniref:hypothetical protein n=1 Tax=Paenibacillus alginolyticus TaxID=59839 RepID=UPI001C25293C
FHRASAVGFRQRLPASYEAAWSLPRLNLHQLVVPSLARRALPVTLTNKRGAAAKQAPQLSFFR